ncbi:RNA binding protein / RBP12 [Leishmania donovani]|uniref:RNA_binding_protein_-_putative n=3 Tax=Leishmania donovani species complex TaxID=38574 RepID=A0A6L0X5Y1_LEIIN|nr:putative RNA binding protein [Leishmania infantum JPCM5]XP_003860073.1 RNA binding protein, putative [Leishmania donovani]CAC9480275.1 RNA_binding_protein_-_putative [Leishmania infantum]CAJ1988002.1 RNA binding protein / RBP12 [Leishmania donovani]CAM67112.1 putative RNA binding protein [Leishmania infantum JPCM5]CBZ33366.1 RNA binding protein, putative [Leishmania donovani]SUZ40983.1 RNA_binding_protein_-_putative [Leishmania infantum]|eukprot:XP_001464875.1 putative RNA binding protein [Leishmania infantum JPCM5]
MERAATQSQSIYSNANTSSSNANTYGNTVSSYLSNNSPNAVMYGGGNSSNGGAPSSTSVATVYASPTQASPSQAIRQQAQGSAQQNMSQSQTSTSFNTYGGGAASGSGSGFFYSTPSAQAPGAQPMYSANASAAAMFPMRGGSTSMTPAQPTPTQMLTPQANAAAAAAAAAVWTSAAANINAGSKLFVGQVPAVCTEDQLRPLFAQFGTLLEIKIMREPNGRSKGSAWVRYELEESAQRAITALNEKHVVPPQTNPLRVQFAAPSTNRIPQPLSALGSIMPPSAVMQPQPQPSYATAATYATPQGYAGATTAYMQGQYATSPNLMAVRASPQQQAAVQSAPGKIEYLRSNQPGGLIYSTASPTAVDAMQQQQQQQQQSPQQQQVVYTTGGQMRAGVMYTPDAFAMTNQMAAAPQQPHQWCS